MNKIAKGLWKIDDPSKLELYKATYKDQIYLFWSTEDFAEEKARDWRRFDSLQRESNL